MLHHTSSDLLRCHFSLTVTQCSKLATKGWAHYCKVDGFTKWIELNQTHASMNGSQVLPRSCIHYSFSVLSRIRVRASNALGHGSFSSALNVATLPPLPEAPQFTGFSHLTANSVRIQWARPNPPRTSIVSSCQASAIASVGSNADGTAITTAVNTMAMTVSPAAIRTKQLCYTLQMSQESDPE